MVPFHPMQTVCQRALLQSEANFHIELCQWWHNHGDAVAAWPSELGYSALGFTRANNTLSAAEANTAYTTAATHMP